MDCDMHSNILRWRFKSDIACLRVVDWILLDLEFLMHIFVHFLDKFLLQLCSTHLQNPLLSTFPSCTDRTLGAFDDMLAVSEGHRISGQPNRVGGGRRFSASAAGQSINNSNRSGSAAIPGGGSNLDASSKLTDYSNSIREGASGADGLDVSSKLSESFSTRDGGSRSGGTTSSKSGTFINILICVFKLRELCTSCVFNLGSAWGIESLLFYCLADSNHTNFHTPPLFSIFPWIKR